MSENRYSTAGWLAIVGAILFPLGFVVALIQGIVGIRAFHYHGPILGISELIFVAVTCISVYILIMFRRLLNERYNFHDVDFLITVSIWWSILFQIGSLGLKGFMIVLWPMSELMMTIINATFLCAAMLTIGVIDIFLAVRLLRPKETFSDLLRGYAVITMISGIAEVSVILTPVALLLAPVSFVLIGLVLLRGEEQVEFV